MQLVGATKQFIQKPFILSGLKHGFFAAMIAIIGLDLIFNFSVHLVPEIQDLQKPLTKVILYIGILILGVLIPLICTYFAVRKYLKLTTDELHY
jgi:cell division transport system permease protein